MSVTARRVQVALAPAAVVEVGLELRQRGVHYARFRRDAQRRGLLTLELRGATVVVARALRDLFPERAVEEKNRRGIWVPVQAAAAASR